MLEAKDTVMKGEQARMAYLSGRTVEVQAEISFKAGIKEIVDWLNKENTLKWKSLTNTPDWFRHCGLGISDEKWQAKLKELGIED